MRGNNMAEKEKKTEEVVMEDPKPVELEVPTAAEKQKRQRKKKEEHVELEQNISIMVNTVFELLAQRDPIWKLSEVEVESVAKPSARIIARMGAEEETNKNADYILLAVGLAGILIPRFMILKARRAKVEQQGSKGEAPAGSAEFNKASSSANAGNVKFLLPSLA